METLHKILFHAVFLIPLHTNTGWVSGHFGKTPENGVSFETQGLKIKVHESASPLFFELPKPLEITKLRATGKTLGLPKLGSSPEGEGASDDYALRIGLIEEGERVSWFKQLFLPAWIKEILALNPNKGVSKVRFFSIAQTQLVGTERVHPKMDLVTETVAFQAKTPGDFDFTVDFASPVNTFALWLQSDGDDTKSAFEILVEKIELSSL